MKNIAIITSGGSGTRIKGKTKKQFIEILKRPLLFWTLDKFVTHPKIDQIIITLPINEIEDFRIKIEEEYNDILILIIAGGNQRQDSVYNALSACPADSNLVLIHDGVRPFISQNEITELINVANQTKAVIPVSKIKNTVKKIDQNKVLRTVPREDLVNAYTPQIFQYELIKQCHEKAKQDGIHCTDDAALLEHYGYSVYTLECSSTNFKVTDQLDLEFTKYLIQNNLIKEKK